MTFVERKKKIVNITIEHIRKRFIIIISLNSENPCALKITVN